jgi:hypothetical protein
MRSASFCWTVQLFTKSYSLLCGKRGAGQHQLSLVHGVLFNYTISDKGVISLIEETEEGRKYKKRILFVGNKRASIDAGRAGEFY